jgi:hypothetical protein
MQVIRALCADGSSPSQMADQLEDQISTPLVLRYCFPLGTENLEIVPNPENEINYRSLELIVAPLKQVGKELPFSTQKDMVDYIFELNEVQELSEENICLKINTVAYTIAKNTRRGVGNCVIAGEAFYKKLTEDMCFQNFRNLFTVLRSPCLLDDCAIVCYRGKTNGWDAGLFLEELPDGQYKFYEVPHKTEGNGKIIYSKAKDYYASLRLKG